MKPAAIVLAGMGAVGWAVPSAAQVDRPEPVPAGNAAFPATAAASSDCPPEHAAMGHCTPAAPAPVPAPMPVGNDPECPPDHAAMGHCTPRPANPAREEGQTTITKASGTDLPPGDAAAPAPPHDWYADRIHSRAEMDRARHAMMRGNGDFTTAFLSIDRAEYRSGRGRDEFAWEVEGWYGGDINRVVVKSEGGAELGSGSGEAELQLLYSRAIGPYFDLRAGIRQDLGSGPERTYAAIGLAGLAPYWFHLDGSAFLSNRGELHGRLEASYDQRITQRLIIQPSLALDLAAQDVPEARIGAGLSSAEFGLRLRYEFVREFAPYAGVTWNQAIGRTARLARSAGEEPGQLRLVLGIKAWF